MNRNDLQRMYGSTPERFQARIRQTLSANAPQPCARAARRSGRSLRVALLTVLMLALLSAAALAAFSSQVADFFGARYGKVYKDELLAGDIATGDHSVTLGGAVYTLSEVVYTESGLYGIGSIRPANDRVVLMAEDYLVTDAAGYGLYQGEDSRAPEGAATYAETAAARGAKLLMASALPDAVGVDGGDVLEVPSVGYDVIPQGDGSLQFSFELPAGAQVVRGDTYAIRLWISNWEISPEGKHLRDGENDTYRAQEWTVEIAPQPSEQKTSAARPAEATPDIGVTLPEGYAPGDPPPVYQAVKRTQDQANFFDRVDAAWFNQSGSRSARSDRIVFEDGAQLSIGVSSVYYEEYDGTCMMYYADTPDEPAGPFPRPSFSNEIAGLAGNVYYDALHAGEILSDRPERTELSGITLEDARQTVDELFTKLGVSGYTCVFALDMSADRIHVLGEAEAQLREKYVNKSDGWWDFSLATEEDEGFYLRYEKRLNGIPVRDEVFYADAFVTAEGIRDFTLREDYEVGGVLETPKRLVTADEVLASFAQDNARREQQGLYRPTPLSTKLLYMPLRAENRADGTVLAPVWYVAYTFEDGGLCDGWAWYSALDGALVEDCYT